MPVSGAPVSSCWLSLHDKYNPEPSIDAWTQHGTVFDGLVRMDAPVVSSFISAVGRAVQARGFVPASAAAGQLLQLTSMYI